MQRRPAPASPHSANAPFTLRPPSLADLREDIAGAIPADLVQRWLESDRSAEAHAALLAPFRARGTIVSSDSAGLSKLTRRYALPQVLKLVSQPKETLHALGTAVGGEPVGVWAADNAQLFFPESIPVERVVQQLLEAQRRIRTGAVQIGIAAHTGSCFRVAGGLFGAEADAIEEIAEDVSRAGEILVTESTLDALPPHLRAGARRCDPDRAHVPLWDLGALSPENPTPGDDHRYPAPFPPAVLELLRARSLDELADERFDEYRARRVCVFLKTRTPSDAPLLDALSRLASAATILERVSASAGGDAVKSTGALAIVLFTSAQDAARFGREALDALALAGVSASAGVTEGEVLVFPLQNGREIAGDPVNLGSKLAEDSGLAGLLVEDAVVRALPDGALGPRAERFSIERSGVPLEGCFVPSE